MKIAQVALDIGNNQTKLAYWVTNAQGGRDIREQVIISRVCAHDQGPVSSFGHSGSESYTYQLSGILYTVYTDSSYGREPVDLPSQGRANGLPIRALAYAALQKAGFSDQAVHFMSNLPIQDFFSTQGLGKARFNDALIDAKIDLLKGSVTDQSLNGYKLPKLIQGGIFAEGAAAYVDFYLDNNGNPQNTLNGEMSNLFVLDIGGGTIDGAVVNTDYSITEPKTVHLGTMKLYRIIERMIKSAHPNIQARYPEPLDIHILERWIIEGAAYLKSIQHQESINIAAQVAEGCQEFGKQISQQYDPTQFNIDGTLLVGGGSNLLKTYLPSSWNVYSPDNPEMANARGLLKIGTFIHGTPDSYQELILNAEYAREYEEETKA